MLQTLMPFHNYNDVYNALWMHSNMLCTYACHFTYGVHRACNQNLPCFLPVSRSFFDFSTLELKWLQIMQFVFICFPHTYFCLLISNSFRLRPLSVTINHTKKEMNRKLLWVAEKSAFLYFCWEINWRYVASIIRALN